MTVKYQDYKKFEGRSTIKFGEIVEDPKHRRLHRLPRRRTSQFTRYARRASPATTVEPSFAGHGDHPPGARRFHFVLHLHRFHHH